MMHCVSNHFPMPLNLSRKTAFSQLQTKGLEHSTIKRVSHWHAILKTFGVSIFQCVLVIWKTKKIIIISCESSYFSAAYLSQKMLNLCNRQTSIPQQKDMFCTEIHSGFVHWRARVCKIGRSLHSSPKHPAETNKTTAERAAIWRSCNAFTPCASPRQSPVLTAPVVRISIHLSVWSHT